MAKHKIPRIEKEEKPRMPDVEVVQQFKVYELEDGERTGFSKIIEAASIEEANTKAEGIFLMPDH